VSYPYSTTRWRYADPWSVPMVRPALLAPLIGIGDLVLLTGAPAGGKSTATISMGLGLLYPQLAHCVLGGALVPNLEAFARGAVAYVDGENDVPAMNILAAPYLRAFGIEKHDERPLQLIHADASVLNVGTASPHDQAIRDGVRSLADLSVRFMIVDSMVPVFRPDDISSATWVHQRLVPFRWACKDAGITAVILCHTARGTQQDKRRSMLPLGTTMQEAIADSVLHIERLGADDRDGVKLTSVKARRAPWVPRLESVRAYFAGDNHYDCPSARDHWPLEAPGVEPVAPQLTLRQQEVLGVLRDAGSRGTTPSDAGRLFDIGPDAASDHLRALKAKGLARTEGSARKTRWYATDDGRPE
jgi:AAA domain